MANMLYNGVELPDIESVWTDKLLYPYAYIGYDEQDGHLLVFVGTPLWHNGNALVFLSNANVKMHGLVNSVWGEGGTGEFPALTELAMPFIWASKDIEYIDTAGGGIYLAASDPVDPNAPTGPVIDLDFWRFAAMGMFLKSVVWGKKATMYSYNGVVLPALPETQLPYAVITKISLGDGEYNYRLTFSAAPLVLKSTTSLKLAPETEDETTDYGEWVKIVDVAGWGNYTLNENEKLQIYAEPTLWANYDIANRVDGGVYLEATKPVPVYA